MNEVKKIHIGRQAFTIAVDAYGDLKKYLDALAQAIKDKEVLEEIELRMVELLKENKITQEKVVLKKDVSFLKQTLGEPSDFADENSSDEAQNAHEGQLPRRFMRDSRGQILGGVANGLASYFGLDPIWFRIAFIALIFASGFGILLYLILWAIMPEAKTSSDYIQMQGKPVTVESITEFAESKELEDGIHRIGKFTGEMLKLCMRIALYVVGIGLTTIGVLGILGSLAGAVFIIGHGNVLFDGVRIFPVNGLEIATVVIGAVAGITASLFMLFSGMGIFAKKWQLPSWATASLLTLFFVSVFTVVPLAGSSVNRISNRIDNAYVTNTRQLDQFAKLNITANDSVRVLFEQSEEPSISIKTFGKKDTSLITTKVEDGVLLIDTSAFTKRYDCKEICVYDTTHEIVIRGPRADTVTLNGPTGFRIDSPLNQSAIEVIRRGGSSFTMTYAAPQKVTYEYNQSRVMLEGLQLNATESDRLLLDTYRDSFYVKRADELRVRGLPEGGCEQYNNVVTVGSRPQRVFIDDALLDTASIAARSSESYEQEDYSKNSQRMVNNCIMVDGSYF